MLTRFVKKDDITICYINGEINIENLARLEEVFRDFIKQKARKVLLNFDKLDYIDSAGLACLIEFSKDLKNIQGVVFLSNLSPKVRSLFAITKLESAFRLYETEEDALKDFYGC